MQPTNRTVTAAQHPAGTKPWIIASAADWLRLSLLACALLIGIGPLYQFVGSMIWFHEYLGDYRVFWGVSRLPLGRIYDHHVFAYPPASLLLFRPFALLPFYPSLIAWSAVGAVAMVYAARNLVRPGALILGFLTFAGLGVLLGGQISLFIGALILTALRSSDPRLQGIALAAAAAIETAVIIGRSGCADGRAQLESINLGRCGRNRDFAAIAVSARFWRLATLAHRTAALPRLSGHSKHRSHGCGALRARDVSGIARVGFLRGNSSRNSNELAGVPK